MQRENSNAAFRRQASVNSVEDTIQSASAIFHSGCKESALRILEDALETDKQVETLMEWSEDTLAFIKALESGNPDLIYLVMLKLRKQMTPHDFHRTIRNFPYAVTLYKKYCHQFNVQLLYEMYVQEKDFAAQAMTLVSRSLDEKELRIRESFLSGASEAYTKARHTFNSSLCDEQLKLFKFQKQLNEKITTYNFIGKTIHEICFLLLQSDPKLAEEFRSEFQIPEKRFWRLKIRALAEMDDWTSLEKLLTMKKCPIESEKFVDVCLQKNNKEQALKYLPTVRERLKVKYLIKMGFLEEAAHMAFKKNDSYTLLGIRSRCKRRSTLWEKVNSMVEQLDTAGYNVWRSFNL